VGGRRTSIASLPDVTRMRRDRRQPRLAEHFESESDAHRPASGRACPRCRSPKPGRTGSRRACGSQS